MLDDFDNMEEFLNRYGLTVVEGDDIGLTLKEGDELKPRACLKQGESEIHCTVMRRRAVEYRGVRSLADGFYMLANQNNILGKFPDFAYIILSGTLLLGSDGKLYMAYLFVDGDRWNVQRLEFERGYVMDDFFPCNDE